MTAAKYMREPGARIRMFDLRSEEDHLAWKRLNLEWLKGYPHRAGTIPFLLEDCDLPILDHPGEKILQRGGFIWLAELGTDHGPKIVGTIALTPCISRESHPSEENYKADWELVRLSVSPAAQGQGIGRSLIATAIDAANREGIRRLQLDSNSHLITAVRLYESFGFQHMPALRGKYVTADVAMSLLLR